MLMHFRYTVVPSFIDSILKAIKNEMGFEGLRELETYLPSRWCCICTYSRLVCTMIDTSSMINAKLGGVNVLPRSHALEKLVSAPFMIMGMGHFRLSLRLIYGWFLLTVRCRCGIPGTWFEESALCG
jgi:hypothetical protein